MDTDTTNVLFGLLVFLTCQLYLLTEIQRSKLTILMQIIHINRFLVSLLPHQQHNDDPLSHKYKVLLFLVIIIFFYKMENKSEAVLKEK